MESYGLKCVRADEVMVSRPVMEDVKQMIAEADLVVVDFTGKNPNVYYEAGLAEAWQKPAIVNTLAVILFIRAAQIGFAAIQAFSDSGQPHPDEGCQLKIGIA